MTNKQMIDKTAAFIEARMHGEASGHDWWHVYRVWQTAKTIADAEPSADRLTVELAALLHDIADWKFADGDLEAGPKAARKWLTRLGAPEDLIKHIEHIIRDTSYKGAKVDLGLKSLEAKIIFDADKLDAIGAIGIARTFAYGGNQNHAMYDPDVKPQLHASFESYKKGGTHTINHFYEKLLLLKDMMYTKTGKQLAQNRHDFMQTYLDQFFAEWSGKA